MAVSEKLMKGILRTIPKKKLAVIQKELTNTEVLVNVRNAIAPPCEDRHGRIHLCLAESLGENHAARGGLRVFLLPEAGSRSETLPAPQGY